MPIAASPMPQAGAGTSPGQPPFGPTGGATMPVPNRGNQAAALGRLQWVVHTLSEILPMVGAENEIGKDVMKALSNLSKHIPPKSGSAGAQNFSLQEMAMQQRQNAPQQQLLRALGQGQPAAGGPPAPAA